MTRLGAGFLDLYLNRYVSPSLYYQKIVRKAEIPFSVQSETVKDSRNLKGIISLF